jgi:hypothetical protein
MKLSNQLYIICGGAKTFGGGAKCLWGGVQIISGWGGVIFESP